jgi:hypothetical protein
MVVVKSMEMAGADRYIDGGGRRVRPEFGIGATERARAK